MEFKVTLETKCQFNYHNQLKQESKYKFAILTVLQDNLNPAV